MSKVRVHNFAVSLDGFATGEGQSLEAPFGHAGPRLMQWAFGTRTFREMGLHGEGPGSTGVDDAFARDWAAGHRRRDHGPQQVRPAARPVGGRAVAGLVGRRPGVPHPGRRPDPPPAPDAARCRAARRSTSSTPTRRPRSSTPARWRAAWTSGIGGGPRTVRQFLAADLVDRMHLVLVPILLGRGERLWDGLEGLEERFAVEAAPSPSGVVHLTFSRR